MSPERRVSRPTSTAPPAGTSAWTVARPSAWASAGLRSTLALPRMPSVPKRRPIAQGAAVGVGVGAGPVVSVTTTVTVFGLTATRLVPSGALKATSTTWLPGSRPATGTVALSAVGSTASSAALVPPRVTQDVRHGERVGPPRDRAGRPQPDAERAAAAVGGDDHGHPHPAAVDDLDPLGWDEVDSRGQVGLPAGECDGRGRDRGHRGHGVERPAHGHDDGLDGHRADAPAGRRGPRQVGHHRQRPAGRLAAHDDGHVDAVGLDVDGRDEVAASVERDQVDLAVDVDAGRVDGHARADRLDLLDQRARTRGPRPSAR